MLIHGQYWRPPASGPPTPSLNGVEQLLEQAALLGQDQPGAHDHQPQVALGLLGGRLPVDDHARVEGRARSGGLVDDRLAAVAVVADRGLADHHPRARARRLDPLDQVAGRIDPARADAPLRLVGPALVERLAEQVDHGVGSLQRLRRRSLGLGIPGQPASPSGSSSRARSGSRESPTTSSPRASSASQTAVPIRPLAPVTRTRISRRAAGRRRPWRTSRSPRRRGRSPRGAPPRRPPRRPRGRRRGRRPRG